MTHEEEWRPIPGWEGEYSISSLGRVRRERAAPGTRAGYVLAAALGASGYRHVVLWRKGRGTTVLIHRCVALAFCGPQPTAHEVNHRDADKGNNRAGNLEWVTPRQNCQHAVQRGLRRLGVKHHNARLTPGTAEMIRRLYGRGWPQTQIAALFVVSRTAVGRVVHGITWKPREEIAA